MEDTRKKTYQSLFFAIDAILIVLIAIGVFYRFNWSNWSQGTNLHPDEYGFTSILTQLRIPESIDEYFNTRISPLSPYNKYDIDGNKIADGPDNRLRWGQFPIILIRLIGEATGYTGYNEIRLLGRHLSALVDTLTLLFVFLMGKQLFGRRVGLMAAALSSLAVMQIQQSHFMTVDQFATLFVVITMYAAVRISKEPSLIRVSSADGTERYNFSRSVWKWYVLFGVGFGMSLASRINLLPLCGLILPACFVSVAGLKLRTQSDLKRIVLICFGYIALAAVVSILTFRVTQPMSFRNPTGDTSIFTFHFNQDWSDSMEVAANESKGINAGPPGEQWAHRMAIIFPLMNMVVWGMGIPFGLAGWAGFIWAFTRLVRFDKDWGAHLLLLTWVGGYFLFMGTRWVKSVRYFLPIYPFLAIFAAWLVVQIWNWAAKREEQQDPCGRTSIRNFFRKARIKTTLSIIYCVVLFGGTLVWASSFVNAIYVQEHTRIQATRWIFDNIPAPFQIIVSDEKGETNPIQIATSQNPLYITPDQPYIYPFTVEEPVELVEFVITKTTAMGNDPSDKTVSVIIAEDPEGKLLVATGKMVVRYGAETAEYRCLLEGSLAKNQQYYMVVSTEENGMIQVDRVTLSNENWDEGLPVPFEGVDPFGEYYQGLTMEVRWYDDANKLEMFIETIEDTDYIILPSQRAIWSAARIPLTYPMTLEYYRALFDGRLGFELVAEFDSPLQIGPLTISDVGGTVAWGKKAELPLFNYNFFAAEEAFSVYDHPPVWIFKKTDDFDIEQVKKVLGAIDLNNVVIQGPRDATMIDVEQ